MTLDEKRRKNPQAVTDDEWRQLLDDQAYHVTREAGTERGFSGDLYEEKRAGTYRCACCLAPLFSSEDKFASGSGWPSFTRPVEGAPVEERRDTSHGMVRTETVCGRCQAHLGHVFEDGPEPTGLRYCINSAALDFEPSGE